MEKDFITLDLRTILSLIKKNIVLIIILFFAGTAGAFFISTFLITPQYEASMTLVVNTRDEQSITITGDQINSARQLVNTYAVILTNETLIDDIIRVLNLNYSVTSLQKRIWAEPVSQTQVMRMTVIDRDPNTAQMILIEIMNRAEELLTTTVKAGSVEIVSPPRINYTPVSPQVGLNTAIGGAIGLFLAMAVIFIRKAMANTFINDEDVATHLGLPVLAVIPSVDVKDR